MNSVRENIPVLNTSGNVLHLHASHELKVGETPADASVEKVLAGPAHGPLAITCLTRLDELRALQPEWDELVAHIPHATPFQSAAWVIATFEHLAADHTLRVLVLRDENGRLVGVVPCSLYVVRPFGVRLFYLFSHHHLFTEHIDALLRIEVVEEATRAIFRYWHEQRATWDLLVLPTVRAESRFVQDIQALAAEQGYRSTTPTVWGGVRQPLPDTWQAFYDSLTRNTRKYIKKFANRLHREGYQERFEIIDQLAGLDAALDLFFDLHRRRALADLSPPHPNYFITEDRQRFLRTVARSLMEQGKLRIGCLFVDERPVAVQLCIIHHNTMHAYYSGFDPQWAWYGVMGNLIRRCIGYAIEQGCTTLDLGLGVDYEKRRWGGQPHPIISLVLASRSIRSRFAFAAFCWQRTLLSRISALRSRRRRDSTATPHDADSDDEPRAYAPSG